LWVDSDPLRAAVACYCLTSESRPSPFTRLDRIIAARVRERGDEPDDEALTTLLPTLLVGGRQAGPSRLLRGAGSTVADVVGLIEGTVEVAAELGARTLVMPYVDASDRMLNEALQALGWLNVPASDYYQMDVAWADFDGYLASFDRHRRHAIRREISRVDSAGVQLAHEPMDYQLIPLLGKLSENLRRKYGSPRPAADIALSLQEFAEIAGDKVSLLTARHDGRVVGYVQIIQWRDDLVFRDLGFDYEFVERHELPLYFALGFYKAAQIAPTSNARCIHYGMGSGEAKVRRGCTAVQQTMYIRALDRESETLLGNTLRA
jgi:predicted N-acyltransferase